MGTLKENLEGFNPETKSELDTLFKGLAESFLYGGYISVADHKEERYRIFIRTAEFYCHYEGDNKDLPKDPIVYHRNGRYVEGEVPYFPLMSFHAHASGYDITFENEKLELRSSALIRTYEVYDCVKECFLVYRKVKDDKGSEVSLFVKHAEGKRYNTQSTYLYNFLNGFLADSVKWIDEDLSTTTAKRISKKSRQNVYEYDDNDVKIVTKGENGRDKFVQDGRKWSFTREDEIKIPKKSD